MDKNTKTLKTLEILIPDTYNISSSAKHRVYSDVLAGIDSGNAGYWDKFKVVVSFCGSESVDDSVLRLIAMALSKYPNAEINATKCTIADHEKFFMYLEENIERYGKSITKAQLINALKDFDDDTEILIAGSHSDLEKNKHSLSWESPGLFRVFSVGDRKDAIVLEA